MVTLAPLFVGVVVGWWARRGGLGASFGGCGRVWALCGGGVVGALLPCSLVAGFVFELSLWLP